VKNQKTGRKLGRKRDQRKALIKSLLNNLVLHEKIKTTEAKAKEIRPKIEKLITRAKKNDLSSRRYLAKYLKDRNAKKLISKIAPKYNNRPGGYTRIIKLGFRKGDASQMANIEFV